MTIAIAGNAGGERALRRGHQSVEGAARRDEADAAIVARRSGHGREILFEGGAGVEGGRELGHQHVHDVVAVEIGIEDQVRGVADLSEQRQQRRSGLGRIVGGSLGPQLAISVDDRGRAHFLIVGRARGTQLAVVAKPAGAGQRGKVGSERRVVARAVDFLAAEGDVFLALRDKQISEQRDREERQAHDGDEPPTDGQAHDELPMTGIPPASMRAMG